MKNSMLLLCALIVTLVACKKQEMPVNKLITGLDPSVTLPNADTTGAFAYFQGSIDGEPFSLVSGKDSVVLTDYASYMYLYANYQKEWLNGVGGAWFFEQGIDNYQPLTKKRWYITFGLPTFKPSLTRDTSQFHAFKSKYVTPGIVHADSEIQGLIISNVDQLQLEIFRTDIYDASGQLKTLGLGTLSVDQTGSYIKLISLRYVDYVPGTDYHYELIYAFDLKLNQNRHLTNGRMKVWLDRIIL